MNDILVNPGALERSATELAGRAEELRSSNQHLLWVMGDLDWEVRVRQDIERRADQVCRQLLLAGEQAGIFARFLREAAQAYRESDQRSGQKILASVGAHQSGGLGVGGTPQAPSGPAAGPQPDPGPVSPSAESYTAQFDGTTPAPGTTNADQVWRPTTPAVTSDITNRSAARYSDVLNQFAVGDNLRYGHRDTNGDGKTDTFCNIFVWDATRAMGAPVPHWIDNQTGEPYPDEALMQAYPSGKAWEMNANATVRWLDNKGEQYGWREASAEEAQAWANQGKPAVAGWDSRSQAAGHVAMVRPTTEAFDPARGPAIAQAGGSNFNDGDVRRGFGEKRMSHVRYFVHD